MANWESQIQDLSYKSNNNIITKTVRFSDFGKEASGLFKSDCGINTKMFTVSTFTASGKALLANVTLRPQRIDACLEAKCKFNEATFCARTHTKPLSHISGYLKLDKEIGQFPSEAKISLRYPHFRLSKLRLFTGHRLGTLAMDIGLNRSPKMTLQASLGIHSLSLGGAVEHLIGSPSFGQLKIGIQASKPQFIFTTHYFPLLKKVRGTCFHYLRTDKKLCVGLKTNHCLATNRSSFMVAGAWSVGDEARHTVLKAMIDQSRKVTACLHCHMPDRNLLVSISAWFDIHGVDSWPKIGFNVSITP